MCEILPAGFRGQTHEHVSAVDPQLPHEIFSTSRDRALVMVMPAKHSLLRWDRGAECRPKRARKHKSMLHCFFWQKRHSRKNREIEIGLCEEACDRYWKLHLATTEGDSVDELSREHQITVRARRREDERCPEGESSKTAPT